MAAHGPLGPSCDARHTVVPHFYSISILLHLLLLQTDATGSAPTLFASMHGDKIFLGSPVRRTDGLSFTTAESQCKRVPGRRTLTRKRQSILRASTIRRKEKIERMRMGRAGLQLSLC